MVIPGYTGYRPHKLPEQVFGCSFATGLAYADSKQTTVTTARIQRPIAGYKGYIPGKIAESFIEEGFGRVWQRSQSVRADRTGQMNSARRLQRELYLRQ